MSCFRPLKAFRTPGGEVKIGTAPGDCWSLELPCGGCLGCKMDRARAWKIRILHESKLYDSSLVLTLSYSDEALKSPSLRYRDFQLFMKRLRKRFEGDVVAPNGQRPIRFFVSAEYGAKSWRPHFHAIVFNVRFPDLTQWRNGRFASKVVDELWQEQGNVVLDKVSGAAVAYTCGYMLKKQKLRMYQDSVLNPSTGELSDLVPPFVAMSNRPGLGAWYYQRFVRDMFPHDFVVTQEGDKDKVPRYYTRMYKDIYPLEAEGVMHGRFLRAQEQRAESTPERRAVKEERAELLQANFESYSL